MSCTACQKAAQALNKVNNIVEGYTNLAISLVVKDSDIEKLACNRMSRCLQCQYKTPLVMVANKQYYSCGKCNCPLDAKTRSTGEQCPIGKW